ncbi:MAG: FHA domain-containing protein [Actinobacteria bacterium]|nr:FHA domain-containing protein [Actinomycetota bacterium]MCL5446473.1 FHA domain-containing protein [Actinomycetota bacterium]
MTASVSNANLLRVLEVFVIAIVWLFFFRVVRSVWAETKPREPAEDSNDRVKYPVAPSHSPAAYPPPHGVGHPVLEGKGGFQSVTSGALPVPGTLGAQTASGIEGIAGAGTRNASSALSRDAADGWSGAAVLKVLEPKESAGRVERVARDVTVGRAPHCGIRTEDIYTSSLHARIYHKGDALWVEDMGSTNGTWVNAQRISKPTHLGRGDLLQIGGTVFEVST